jgi:hypothetical protein
MPEINPETYPEQVERELAEKLRLTDSVAVAVMICRHYWRMEEDNGRRKALSRVLLRLEDAQRYISDIPDAGVL